MVFIKSGPVALYVYSGCFFFFSSLLTPLLLILISAVVVYGLFSLSGKLFRFSVGIFLL